MEEQLDRGQQIANLLGLAVTPTGAQFFGAQLFSYKGMITIGKISDLRDAGKITHYNSIGTVRAETRVGAAQHYFIVPGNNGEDIGVDIDAVRGLMLITPKG